MATVVLHLSPKPPPPLLFYPSTTRFFHYDPYRYRRVIPKIPLASSKNGSNSPPETECPVPIDQQPINEYQNLSTSFLFSWASGDMVEYCSRLFITGASFALFIGLPVAWLGAVGPDSESEPLKRVLGAASSGIFAVTLAVVRMYLGWAYVGNRLLSATVEYEETGWYDGQIWVKTAEVLARDRLLGSYTVKPVLSRLKYTLVSLGVLLFACVLLLINLDESQKISYAASEAGGRAVAGVYDDNSARSFEPEAFCGEPETYNHITPAETISVVGTFWNADSLLLDCQPEFLLIIMIDIWEIRFRFLQ